METRMPFRSTLFILLGPALLLLGCSKTLSTGSGQGSLTDSKGNKYIVRMMPDGRQWITENLKIDLTGSYCYNDSTQYCSKYGRLYTWKAAKEGCAMLGKGWRLPTNDDYEQMAKYYGGIRTETGDGKAAYKSWIENGNSQFNILFGGTRDPSGGFSSLEAHGFYWTETESDPAHAWFYNLGKGGQLVNRHEDGEKLRAVSVRCVK
jgi:uncharacterized protein (TIGR02145 family)